jgi:undecaprenyl phosphate N,N'-diacetylbacillosamine 1-phosphate transferase
VGASHSLYKSESGVHANDECGIALRSSSLDELPELFAILKGDMSFVGPRPLPTYYGPYFYDEELKRHNVRGGLIPPDGLCGETTPKWETQFEYDTYYAENVSFILDCKIIIATFKILFDRVKNDYGAEDRPHLNEYREHIFAEREMVDELPIN